jgi:chemotaxis response regulator CheB
MEKSIRVLVANRPRLMRETILSTFADQPDIEIVGEVEDESEIFASVKKTLPNFVVVALDHPGERPRICDALLREHPEVRVIAVAPTKNYVVYYWASLDIHSSSIEASEEGVLGALRNKLVITKTN